MAGYDRRLLRHKIEWEGGVLDALQYGIHASDIDDPELRALWAELEAANAKVGPAVSTINHIFVGMREPAEERPTLPHNQFDRYSLRRKVNWEGGVVGALEYGISWQGIDDPELSELWHMVEEAYEALTPIVTRINLTLREA